MIDISVLHDIFRLDRETGKLYWRIFCGAKCPGDEAGWLDPAEGYLQLTLPGDRKTYYVHRIVFAMVNGRWPKQDTDHKNRIRSDNRPDNIREATRSQNNFNSAIRKDNKSGCKGVSWHKQVGKWQVRMSIDRRYKSLGLFVDKDEAIRVYRTMAAKIHGEFGVTA